MNFSTRLFPLLLAALTLPLSQLLFPGCATMADGPSKRIKVDSRPPGATVYVNGKAVGLTPTMIVVSRWRNPRLRIEMPGFKPYELQLEKQLNWKIEGNLFLGFAPVLIDAATGSMFQLYVPKDRQREVETKPWGGEDSEALFISVMLKRDPTARQIGRLQRQ